jgi:hypothetical protein
VFSLKVVARPDPRMVEVPLEIEAELPREFDGAALLASSGLPRKVKLKAPKDALKLSTAYRADQLIADIVRTTLRGTLSDVQRVQEAATRFIRTVRERRKEGAALTITANGQGQIDVSEATPAPRLAPMPAQVAARPPAGIDRRITEIEAAVSRLSGVSDIAQRIQELEQRLAQVSAQLTHLTAISELAGPGMNERPGTAAAQREGTPRRATAVEAFAEGLRAELKARATAAIDRGRKDLERVDKAAALAAEAELLGAPRDGVATTLRERSAQAAARISGLERLLDELDWYAPADLPMAHQLLARLERTDVLPDLPATLEPVTQAVTRVADSEDRAAWLSRAAALCGWDPASLQAAPAAGPVDTGSEQIRLDADLDAMRAAQEAVTRPVPLPAPTAASVDPTLHEEIAAIEPEQVTDAEVEEVVDLIEDPRGSD